jgi:hypothetical protein
MAASRPPGPKGSLSATWPVGTAQPRLRLPRRPRDATEPERRLCSPLIAGARTRHRSPVSVSAGDAAYLRPRGRARHPGRGPHPVRQPTRAMDEPLRGTRGAPDSRRNPAIPRARRVAQRANTTGRGPRPLWPDPVPWVQQCSVRAHVPRCADRRAPRSPQHLLLRRDSQHSTDGSPGSGTWPAVRRRQAQRPLSAQYCVVCNGTCCVSGRARCDVARRCNRLVRCQLALKLGYLLVPLLERASKRHRNALKLAQVQRREVVHSYSL